MKSLSTNRPMVLLMVGIPGAGKSHFARQFADIFHAPIVSYDKINYLLFAEPSFTKEEEVLVASLMNTQIKELFKTNKTFIIDGALNTKSARSEIAKLARKYDYGMLVVWVQTDLDSSKYRSTTRSNKRPGDAYNVKMTDEQFMSFAKRINPPQRTEEFIVISGKHTFASQAKAVLKKIVSPREIPVVSVNREFAPAPKTRPATKRSVSL